MKRPLAVAGISFFLSLAALSFIPYRFILIIVCALMISVLITFLAARKYRTVIVGVLISAVAACAAFSVAQISYSNLLKYSNTEIPLTLTVTSESSGNGSTFQYETKIADCPYDDLIGKKVLLIAYDSLDIEAFQEISFNGTLLNFEDYSGSMKVYLKSQGEYFKVYISEKYSLKAGDGGGVDGFLYRLRGGISSVIDSGLSPEIAAVVKSILLGNRDSLDYRTENAFKEAGLTHIFCVSGLHISIISYFIFKLISALCRKKKLVYVLTIPSVWFFIVLTGFSRSALRAGIMITIYYVGRLIYRDANPLNSLGAAVLLLTVLDPFAAGNISLLYSFFATLGILILPGIKPKFIGRIGFVPLRRVLFSVFSALSTSVKAIVFTLPLQVFFFDTATLISPLSNLLTFFAIPVIMTFALFGVVAFLIHPFISVPFFYVCGVFTKYIILVAKTVSSIPFATVGVNEDYVKIWIVTALAIGFMLVILRRSRRAKAFAAAVCAVALVCGIICSNALFAETMSIHILRQGNGSAIVVCSGGDTVAVVENGSRHCVSDNGRVEVRETFVYAPDDAENESEYGQISGTGELRAGNMTVKYDYGEGCSVTLIENGVNSVLIISKANGETVLKDGYTSADSVIIGKKAKVYSETLSVKAAVIPKSGFGNIAAEEAVCYDVSDACVIFKKNGYKCSDYCKYD